MYPDQKVGLIWDHAHQHYCEEVNEVIEEMNRAGRLNLTFGAM
mgnify:CR=1 FL=1